MKNTLSTTKVPSKQDVRYLGSGALIHNWYKISFLCQGKYASFFVQSVRVYMSVLYCLQGPLCPSSQIIPYELHYRILMLVLIVC